MSQSDMHNHMLLSVPLSNAALPVLTESIAQTTDVSIQQAQALMGSKGKSGTAAT